MNAHAGMARQTGQTDFLPIFGGRKAEAKFGRKSREKIAEENDGRKSRKKMTEENRGRSLRMKLAMTNSPENCKLIGLAA
jgi:hypothetical protein